MPIALTDPDDRSGDAARRRVGRRRRPSRRLGWLLAWSACGVLSASCFYPYLDVSSTSGGSANAGQAGAGGSVGKGGGSPGGDAGGAGAGGAPADGGQGGAAANAGTASGGTTQGGSSTSSGGTGTATDGGQAGESGAVASDGGSRAGAAGGGGKASGGVAAMGGALGTGGIGGAGGKASGGGAGTGGANGTGGISGAGGAASGGGAGTGGVIGTGGITGTGGTTGKGGAGTGGAIGTGGSVGNFSFFVTSFVAIKRLSASQNGFGGDLRYGQATGLAGADKICGEIAETAMVGAGAKTWHAFLSVAGPPVVNAIDRVGNGPWYDRKGRLLAMTKTALAMARPQGADPAILNDLPNEDGVPNHNPDGTGNVDNHNTLTGSNNMGNLDIGNGATCTDWTSSTGVDGQRPRVGHSWPRAASGTTWMSALYEGGCAPGVNLVEMGGPQPGVYTVGTGGGYGGFYCFALTP